MFGFSFFFLKGMMEVKQIESISFMEILLINIICIAVKLNFGLNYIWMLWKVIYNFYRSVPILRLLHLIINKEIDTSKANHHNRTCYIFQVYRVAYPYQTTMNDVVVAVGAFLIIDALTSVKNRKKKK